MPAFPPPPTAIHLLETTACLATGPQAPLGATAHPTSPPAPHQEANAREVKTSPPRVWEKTCRPFFCASFPAIRTKNRAFAPSDNGATAPSGFCQSRDLSRKVIGRAVIPSLLALRPRAHSGQIESFDQNNFMPQLGAPHMAIRNIDKEAQQRHGAKEPGLRWGRSVFLLCYCSCSMLRHRASRRA